MRYLRKFNESVIDETLLGQTFQEVEIGDTWNLLDSLSKHPGPSLIHESEMNILEEILLSYYKPELTGAELKYKSIYSLGRLDPKDIMSKVNWKLEYPNEMRFDVNVTKFEDGYFFVKAEGVPVMGDTPRKPTQVKHMMKSDDIYLETRCWLIDGWDGFEDWVNSSPISESNNYDLLKYELKDYNESRKMLLVGRKTNEYRTLMTNYRKIGNDTKWHLFDDDGYHFGTISNLNGEFRHDGSVDNFGRRKTS
jgi:hypothetical protein